jgi:hypothetical protein
VTTRDELREHLIRRRIAGAVGTPRENNLRHYRLFAQGDPLHRMGLDPRRTWTPGRVLELMAERVGVNPDPSYRSGPDRIDPERTLDALDAFGERLLSAVRERTTVLAGTGHPGPLLGLHATLVRELRRAGCPISAPAVGRTLSVNTPTGPRRHLLHAERDVVFLARRAENSPGGAVVLPAHSHSPLPVRATLDALAAAGDPLPGLVIGDHGWVCGAGQAGVPAIGFADSNDPALFVGEAEGTVAVSVPLDDGVSATFYRPIAQYLLEYVGLSG